MDVAKGHASEIDEDGLVIDLLDRGRGLVHQIYGRGRRGQGQGK
jgi:hypothetical protein